MQDIQPPPRQSSQMTPNQTVRGRLNDLRNQMEIERSSPYSSELYNALISNIRDDLPEDMSG